MSEEYVESVYTKPYASSIFKECPYCKSGASALFLNIISYAGPNRSATYGGCVVCSHCRMNGPWGPNHAEAILAWNALPREEKEQ